MKKIGLFVFRETIKCENLQENKRPEARKNACPKRRRR